MARQVHIEKLWKLLSHGRTGLLATMAYDAPAYRAALSAQTELSRRQVSSHAHNSAVLPAEVEKFRAMAETWWDENGGNAFLLKLNSARVPFIRDAAASVFGVPAVAARPLEGLSILDVGCGGGLLSEVACAQALARLGGEVTGLDAGSHLIQVAKQHAAQDPAVQARTQYIVGTAEELAASGRRYDLVVASEVIEHVPDPKSFCRALSELAAAPGAVVVSTLNRTPRAYAVAIGAAEYLLGLVPRGTHEWNKFVTPEELVMMMAAGGGAELGGLSGMVYSSFSGSWSLSSDTAVNYIAFFRKTRPATLQ